VKSTGTRLFLPKGRLSYAFSLRTRRPVTPRGRAFRGLVLNGCRACRGPPCLSIEVHDRSADLGADRSGSRPRRPVLVVTSRGGPAKALWLAGNAGVWIISSMRLPIKPTAAPRHPHRQPWNDRINLAPPWDAERVKERVRQALCRPARHRDRRPPPTHLREYDPLSITITAQRRAERQAVRGQIVRARPMRSRPGVR
jgi:hypothetical protein